MARPDPALAISGRAQMIKVVAALKEAGYPLRGAEEYTPYELDHILNHSNELDNAHMVYIDRGQTYIWTKQSDVDDCTVVNSLPHMLAYLRQTKSRS